MTILILLGNLCQNMTGFIALRIAVTNEGYDKCIGGSGKISNRLIMTSLAQSWPNGNPIAMSLTILFPSLDYIVERCCKFLESH
jgi:hypothetical protein